MKTCYKIRVPEIRVQTVWDYIIVYLLLILNAGFVFRHQYNRYTLPVYLVLLFMTMIAKEKKLKCDTLVPTISLIILIMLTAVLTGGGYYERYIYFIASTITAYLLTSLFDYKTFYRIFSNCLYYICLASIIGWFLVELAPSVIYLFPRLENNAGFDAYYLGLTILNAPSYVGFENRAMGIFWEPGAFQTMIVIAMLGDIFINSHNNLAIRYIVYFVTLILTKSTTGYICLMILGAVLLVKEGKIGIPHIIAFFSMILGIVLLFNFRHKLPDFIYFTLFTKIDAVFSYRPGMHIGTIVAQKTAFVRMDSLYYPLIEFLKSPLWGIGFSGYDRISDIIGYQNMHTFTLINYFAYFGIIYACISINGLMRIIRNNKTNILCKALIVVLLIISTSSEDFCGGTACITVFLLYGYFKYNKKIVQRNR